MKDKVVVFTENNARILINPQDLKAFENKTSAFINPDLAFVKGLEPHYWKLLNTDSLKLQDAKALLNSINEEVDWTEESPDYQEMFYREVYHKLKEEIGASEKSATLVARLLEKAIYVDKLDVIKHLEERFVSPSKNAAQIKENKAFYDLIKNWSMCNIIPMDPEERAIRDIDILKRGINNTLTPKPRLNKWWWMLVPIVIVVVSYIKYKIR